MRGATEEARIGFGGPLATDTVFAVGAAAGVAPEGTLDLGQGLRFAAGLGKVKALSETQGAAANLKLLRGYAGWGPGQLEREISAGAWTLLALTAELVFDAEPETQWERLTALRRATRLQPARPQASQARLGLDEVHPFHRLNTDVADLRALQNLERHRGAALAEAPEFFVKRFQ